MLQKTKHIRTATLVPVAAYIQYWMYAATGESNMKWGSRAPLAPRWRRPVFIVRIPVYFTVQSGFIWNHWVGACMWLLNTDILAGNAAKRDTADKGKPRIVSYCVKRSMSKSIAVLPQVWKIHC